MLSLLTTILGFALVSHTQAHVSITSIYGSNNVVGNAFGVDINGKYPRVKGAPGDAGGDSGIFQTGTDNPSPACGSTPELGPLDTPAWLDQAEGFGLPAAYSNMSIVLEVFQVNRDGGGPMSCEYNDDATADSWKPMFISLNQAGNAGIQNQQRVNSTVVANFPQNASCTGGFTQTACIVRCRTGVNRRFGGCFAVKLSNSEAYSATTSTDAGLNSTSVVSRVTTQATVGSDAALSDEDLTNVAQKIVESMQSSGFLISAAAVATLRNTTLSITNSTSGIISHLVQTTQPVSNMTGLAKINLTSNDSAHNSTDTLDAANASDAASDAADASDAASDAADASDAASDAADASDAASDAADASDAASDAAETPANATQASNTSDNSSTLAVPTNQPAKQVNGTTQIANQRSKRFSCGAHRKRHKTTLSH